LALEDLFERVTVLDDTRSRSGGSGSQQNKFAKVLEDAQQNERDAQFVGFALADDAIELDLGHKEREFIAYEDGPPEYA
jgi:hypothetical protein